jgi:4-diphosphocytidyl-2-C-methyl-D-erythritol kinase
MTPHSITCHAFAKVNLTLDVFSKRSDGYHSLASVFQAISLSDTLTLTPRSEPGIAFQCDSPDGIAVPTDDSNLVVRAAKAAMEAAGSTAPGIEIRLEKRIPSQAGLGGGSSDAAATLVGINEVLGLGLAPAQLADLAGRLGSDVPFFLHGGTASARGRGETLTSLPDIPRLWLVVVKPEANVSTSWAYGELDAIPDRPSNRATKRMEEAIRGQDWERLISSQSNDFELPIFQHVPSIAWVADELTMAGALTARLCGSGSALYGIARDEASARRMVALLQQRYAQVYVAHSLTRAESHPIVSLKGEAE